MKRTKAGLLAAVFFLGCSPTAPPAPPKPKVAHTKPSPKAAEHSCPAEGNIVEPPAEDVPLAPSAAMRLLCAREETWSASISIEGIVVKTNLAEIPTCAIHPAGIADPYDCRSPVPTFWLADSPSAPESTWIPVMGWASNAANLYEHALQEAESVNPDSYEDSFWGVIVPSFSLGGRVTVWGSYAKTFDKTSSGWERQPTTGVLSYRELMETAPGKTRAILPSLRATGRTARDAHSKSLADPRPPRILPLSGPFPELDQYCVAPLRGDCVFDESALATDLKNSIVRLQPQGGFAEVSLFSKNVDAHVTYFLGLRTSRGWFVADPGFATYGIEATGFMSSVLLRQLRHESPGPDGSSVVSVRVERETYVEDRVSETRELVVCEVGKSHVPRCTAPLVYSERTTAGEAYVAYDLVPHFVDGGLLRLSPFWFSGEPPAQAGLYNLFEPR